MRKTIFILLLSIGTAFTLNAQTTEEPFKIQPITAECEEIPTYVNKNREEHKTLKVAAIEGATIMYAGELFGPDPNAYYKGACIALFTEVEHKLVKHQISDKNGRFAFEGIPEGRYRLLVKHPGRLANIANIPLEVSSSIKKRKSIMIYMIGNNMAQDSFAKLK